MVATASQSGIGEVIFSEQYTHKSAQPPATEAQLSFGFLEIRVEPKRKRQNIQMSN